MDAVVALLAFAAVGFGAAFGVLPLQSRRERQDRSRTADDEWIDSGFSLSRSDFELCRIMPTEKWALAEFVYQDESRREFGRYTSISRYRGSIGFAGRSAVLYIQGSGLNRSAFAGNVGGISKRSVVIREDERVLVEVLGRFEKGELVREVRAENRTLTIRSPRFAFFSRGRVFEGALQVGQYRRKAGVSRRVLFALDRRLPEDLRVCLCSLALLQ